MKGSILIVHGLGGSGPGHWQTWLAESLATRGLDVHNPDLPSPDKPSLEPWLATLESELEGLDPEGLVVLCHSLGSVTWLHLAARAQGRLAERVLLVAHQVVVLLVRYVLEGMDEHQVLAVDAEAEVINCSVTSYVYDKDVGRMALERYNEATPLEEQDETVTAEPDAPGAPR